MYWFCGHLRKYMFSVVNMISVLHVLKGKHTVVSISQKYLLGIVISKLSVRKAFPHNSKKLNYT